MPTVPVYSRPQVATAPLPGVTFDTGAPAAAFERPGSALAGTVPIGLAFAEHQQQQADQVAINTAQVQAHTVKLDAQRAALALRGTDALKARDVANDVWQQGVAKISDSLHFEHQKALFAHRTVDMYADLSSTVERHANQEFFAHDKQQTDALLGIAKDDAIAHAGDPDRIALAAAKTKATLTDFGKRNGWSPEQIANATAQSASDLHLSVLEQILAAPEDQGGGDIRASAYLAAHRADLQGADLVRAEKLTDAGSVLGQSQRQADAILREAPDLAHGLAAAGAITDPRVRDATEHRVRQSFMDRAADAREQQAAAYHRSAAKLEQNGGNFDAIPLADRVLMSPEQNATLQHRADQIRHPKEFGDPETYFQLLNLASLSPQSRQQFLSENLLSYKNLSSAERSRLLGLQRQISLTVEGRAYSAAMHANVLARKDAEDKARLDDGLARAALIQNPDERKAEEARVRQHYADVQSYRHLVANAPAGDATPPAVGFTPTHPLSDVLAPAPVVTKPTPQMLQDAAKSPRYAAYLRSMHVDLPDVLPAPTPDTKAPK